MKSSARGVPSKLPKPTRPKTENIGWRNAERIVDACIWDRKERGKTTCRINNPISQKRYNDKRGKKDSPGYKAHMEARWRYEHSLPVPPRRKWEPWELKFLAQHPFHSSREIADALGRSIKSILSKRMDFDGSKARASNKRAYARRASKKVDNIPPKQAR